MVRPSRRDALKGAVAATAGLGADRSAALILEASDMSGAMEPFRRSFPEPALENLHRRLDRARWPDRETVDDG